MNESKESEYKKLVTPKPSNEFFPTRLIRRKRHINLAFNEIEYEVLLKKKPLKISFAEFIRETLLESLNLNLSCQHHSRNWYLQNGKCDLCFEVLL